MDIYYLTTKITRVMFVSLTELRFSLMVQNTALRAITMIMTLIIYFEKTFSTETTIFKP